MDERFFVRFWGVRGGYPVPGPTTVAYGGNTSCVEVQVAGHTLILDAGTGLIGLGEELAQRAAATGEGIRATLLFSHTHGDHTQGLPYFRPVHMGSSVLTLFGPSTAPASLANALAAVMGPVNFPIELADLDARIIIQELTPQHQLYLWPGRSEPLRRHRFADPLPDGADEAVRVDIAKSYAHPRHGVLVYRISYRGRSVVYATDTEGYIGGDQRLAEFARGADLLIHDAQYSSEEYGHAEQPRQGWGHSTLEMALEVAALARVKQLAFFHHDPHNSDARLEASERAMQLRCADSFMAREGLCVLLDER